MYALAVLQEVNVEKMFVGCVAWPVFSHQHKYVV